MENGYETFITDLRKLLLAAMELEEGKIYFARKGEMYGCTGDRLFVECGSVDKTRQVCGLHTEELYERYCQEHKLENIIHDCIREIKAAGLPQPGKSSCFFCPSMKKQEILYLKEHYPDLFNRAATLEENAMPYLKTVKGLGRSYSWKEQFGKE